MKLLAIAACLYSFAISIASCTDVLFPLYPKPGPEGSGWSKFFEIVERYPTLQFNAILNINNGGPAPGPDTDLTSGVEKLKKYKNVRILGYVTTGVGTRNASRIQADVDMWAGWPGCVRVDGIFFDEAEKGNIPGSWDTLKQVISHARSKGVGKHVIQNVGTIPVNETVFDFANSTVIHEGTWPSYQSAIPGVDAIKADGSKLALFIWCIPDFEMYWQVRKFSQRNYGAMFLSDGGTFQQFYPYLDTFVAAMNRFNGKAVPVVENIESSESNELR